VLTNTSGDASHYEWHFPDGTISMDESPVYVINEKERDGNLSIQLIAFSKNRKKMHLATQTIHVAPAYGKLQFWVPDVGQGYAMPDNAYARVVIKGVEGGWGIFVKKSSAPDCSYSGLLEQSGIFYLACGFYYWQADSIQDNFNWYNTPQWSGTVEVRKDVCTTVKLY